MGRTENGRPAMLAPWRCGTPSTPSTPPAPSLAEPDEPALADQLGAFLRALHSFPADEAERLGVGRHPDWRSHARLRERVEEGLPALARAAPDLVAPTRTYVDGQSTLIN